MKDWAIIIATIFSLEIVELVFGKAVGMAVAVTGLIGCVLFLWHAGKDAA